jgi:hypothetical protein
MGTVLHPSGGCELSGLHLAVSAEAFSNATRLHSTIIGELHLRPQTKEQAPHTDSDAKSCESLRKGFGTERQKMARELVCPLRDERGGTRLMGTTCRQFLPIAITHER